MRLQVLKYNPKLARCISLPPPFPLPLSTLTCSISSPLPLPLPLPLPQKHIALSKTPQIFNRSQVGRFWDDQSSVGYGAFVWVAGGGTVTAGGWCCVAGGSGVGATAGCISRSARDSPFTLSEFGFPYLAWPPSFRCWWMYTIVVNNVTQNVSPD